MKQQRHPNYYQLLLLAGARVARPLEMFPGAIKGKGRVWTAKAKLRIKGFDIYLESKFHGNLVETEETAQANLNIEKVRMYVEGGSDVNYIDFTRSSFKAVMLPDGLYLNGDWTEKIGEEMKDMFKHVPTAHYMGIPEREEYQRIVEFGYRKIFGWGMMDYCVSEVSEDNLREKI